MVVHAGVGDVRGHAVDRVAGAAPDEGGVAGGIELHQVGSVQETLGPLGPAARRVFAGDGEDGRALARVVVAVREVELLAGDLPEICEGRLPPDQVDFCELALKVSGAVQAARWSRIHGGGGYIYSFNGPHSLFVDTIRSVRIVHVAHALGHRLMGENDAAHSLLERGLAHVEATAKYSVFYGEGRDSYDVPAERGRTTHEAIFNPNDGRYRCPNSQQGYSGFTTWTRGLAWAMVGFAEELEFLGTVAEAQLIPYGGQDRLRTLMLKAARATCDWYIANTALDGIPYWDGGAPHLGRLGDWRARPAEPFNDFEPVDSSAAAIGAQGLLRLGHYLGTGTADGRRYWQAGLTTMRTLLGEPYLGTAPDHQGLLLHSVYHRPNGWDHVPAGRKVPCGEACLWGDYHLREAALYLQRVIRGEKYYTFFGCLKG